MTDAARGEGPVPDNSAEPLLRAGEITFSYLSSRGTAITETRPILTVADLLARVAARRTRFHQAGPAARESEASRRDRKYVAAQPAALLRAAWRAASGPVRMELEMMLDPKSHHGLSDPRWLAQHATATATVEGDDQRPLGAAPAAPASRRTVLLAHLRA